MEAPSCFMAQPCWSWNINQIKLWISLGSKSHCFHKWNIIFTASRESYSSNYISLWSREHFAPATVLPPSLMVRPQIYFNSFPLQPFCLDFMLSVWVKEKKHIFKWSLWGAITEVWVLRNKYDSESAWEYLMLSHLWGLCCVLMTEAGLHLLCQFSKVQQSTFLLCSGYWGLFTKSSTDFSSALNLFPVVHLFAHLFHGFGHLLELYVPCNFTQCESEETLPFKC